MRPIAPHVFRAYDIRGLVGIDFDEEWAHRLGLACGTFFQQRGQRTAVVGHDCRATSPGYAAALIRGLTETGVSAINLGMVPTPLMYFAVKRYGTAAGVMVTASHNPSAYNGFKIWSGESTIFSAAILALRDIMEKGNFASGKGACETRDIFPAYADDVAGRIRLAGPLTVAVDGGNGAGGEYCSQLLTRLGATVIPLYCEPDGTFPNHHPDPVVEANMADLKALVIESKAAFGIGLDGDADRVGAVDDAGRLLFGDELLAILARPILARKPGSLILGDVKCSHRLFRDIQEHGGKSLMCPTGHSFMKAKLRELGAELGGEMSGHMFFADNWHGFDDAIYAAARLAAIVSAAREPLSALLGWPESFVTPELHVPCPDAVKTAVIETARAYFKERYEVLEIDGVRLLFPDGWGLVRASNTQPALVLRFEAESPERLAAIRALVQEPLAGWIAEAAPAVPGKEGA